MNTQEYIAMENQYGAHNYHPLDVVIERGQGIWVWDVEGKKYMDCLAGYSALNQGHCHPRLIKAMLSQVEKVTLTGRAFRNNLWPLFARDICKLLGYEMILPMNTGAEAVETAIKVARKWGYKIKKVDQNAAEIIVCSGNFHGRTSTIISFSDDPIAKNNYGPYTPGFVLIEYGNIEALEAAITKNTVAFLVEPVQGEAGIVIPPAGYLRNAARICRDNNVLLICDEIQSGLGRTGKLLASQHEDVKPDIITIGKALSGGVYPVSAVLANREILGVVEPGSHGSTYGGNPLAVAISREAIKILLEEKLVENAATLGPYFIDQVKNISSPHIDLVRGIGLWIGIVLNKNAGGARRFSEAFLKEGILTKETHERILRISPPLIIKKEEIDWAVARIEKVMNGTLR